MKTLFIFVLLIMSSGLFAQQYDSRLLDSYDAEVLESLAHNDPHKLELLHYAIDHGMYISENGNSKSNQLPEVTWTEDMQSFVDLGLQITDQNQYFQIKNEDKVLVVKSFWVLNNELENK